METENGTWSMKGIPDSDPGCIRTAEELEAYIGTVGFLPLFSNAIAGFSVEEHTNPVYWWTEHPRDPWEWRRILADRGNVAYGKFFGGRAGFLSLRWLPIFANWRRDGYDFDALWEEGKATHRAKKIMDLFPEKEERFSFEIKKLAGFSKDGEKNFEGSITELQMKQYLVVRDFRPRRNKAGAPYGWNIAVYTTPEARWGYDLVTSAYGEAPELSHQRVVGEIRNRYPGVTEKMLRETL